MTITKKFGHHVYDLYARYPTEWQAKKGAIEARKSFSRVRIHHNVIKETRKGLNEWFVFADVRSLKDPEQPAYQKGGVVHSRRIR